MICVIIQICYSLFNSNFRLGVTPYLPFIEFVLTSPAKVVSDKKAADKSANPK